MIVKLLVFPILLFMASCSESGGSGDPILAKFGYDWKSVLKTGAEGGIGTPLPPTNLLIEKDDTGIGLSWDIPRTYINSKMNIGYFIARKGFLDEQQNAVTWDFNSAESIDFDYEVGFIKAAECEKEGRCYVLDEVTWASSMAYAVVPYWDVSERTGRGEHASGTISRNDANNLLSFDVGFTDNQPTKLLGHYLPDRFRDDPDMELNGLIFDFTPNTIPWFLMMPDKSSLTMTSNEKRASPIVAKTDLVNEIKYPIPNPGLYKGIMMSTGLSEICSGTTQEKIDQCKSLLDARSPTADFMFGQDKTTLHYSPDTNPLLPSRKFESRSMATLKSTTGKEYLFVADKNRILIRSSKMESCNFDTAETEADGQKVAGTCGFEWSIGTESPRMMCHARSDGSVARESGGSCSSADIEYSNLDSTAPTDYSLRQPGVPIIVGNHLYIPDTGNARVVRLPNFETALQTCGRLRSTSDNSANDFCKFDLTLGQYGVNKSDAARFTKRTCIKGGERGGFDGAIAVADSTDFTDPLSAGGSGGAACRLDYYTYVNGDGVSVTRKHRAAADYKGLLGDMSPETGLMDERTKRTFRAPTELAVDEKGRLYVLDHGFTKVQSADGASFAVLPPRVMVWSRNPLAIQECIPTNPGAETPSCSINQDGLCSGDGCTDKQCEGVECDASFALGQRSILYGFQLSDGQDIYDVKPSGFAPIFSMGYAQREDMRGLWTVTGRDASIYHWKDINQLTNPVIHHEKSAEEQATDDISSLDLFVKSMNFIGVTITELSGELTFWDSRFYLGVGWAGNSTED